MFARCSFCASHLALRHGERNGEDTEEGILYVEGDSEAGKKGRWCGESRESEKRNPHRSFHSFTKIICRIGAAAHEVCKLECVRACASVLTHLSC